MQRRPPAAECESKRRPPGTRPHRALLLSVHARQELYAPGGVEPAIGEPPLHRAPRMLLHRETRNAIGSLARLLALHPFPHLSRPAHRADVHRIGCPLPVLTGLRVRVRERKEIVRERAETKGGKHVQKHALLLLHFSRFPSFLLAPARTAGRRRRQCGGREGCPCWGVGCGAAAAPHWYFLE